MRPSAYIAVVLFAAWGLYMAVRLPHWHDPKYVRRPERRMWAFWQFLDDDEWTEEGRILRRRYVRSMGVALLVAFGGIVLSRLLEAYGY